MRASRFMLFPAAALFLSSTLFVVACRSNKASTTSSVVQRQEARQKAFRELEDVVDVFCNNIYPKPTLSECMEKVKHGIGNSFDPHSQYMDSVELKEIQEETEGAFGGLGLKVRKPPDPGSSMLVVGSIDGTPAQQAGVLVGDVITHIIILDGKNEQIYPTASLSLRKAVRLLRGEIDTSVRLRIVRKGVEKPLEFTLVRKLIKTVQVEGELLRDGGNIYGLISNKLFHKGNSFEVAHIFYTLEKRAGGKLSGLIISLEDNPGGLLFEVDREINLFINSPSFVLVRGNNGSIKVYNSGIGLFSMHGDITNGIPILVVVNGSTASASEIFAGTMKHVRRAVIAGTSKTFGKGTVQQPFPVSDGGRAMVTMEEYLIGTENDWVPVQCVGIEPDILFEYPGITKRSLVSECKQTGVVASGGPMKNPPVHPPIKEANPKRYRVAEQMLRVYIAHRLPVLQKEQIERKTLEKE